MFIADLPIVLPVFIGGSHVATATDWFLSMFANLLSTRVSQTKLR